MFEVSTYAQPFCSCLINLWMILFPFLLEFIYLRMELYGGQMLITEISKDVEIFQFLVCIMLSGMSWIPLLG